MSKSKIAIFYGKKDIVWITVSTNESLTLFSKQLFILIASTYKCISTKFASDNREGHYSKSILQTAPSSFTTNTSKL